MSEKACRKCGHSDAAHKAFQVGRQCSECASDNTTGEIEICPDPVKRQKKTLPSGRSRNRR